MTEEEFWERVQNNLAPDPVREYEDGWYFWDETWADKHGPYDTEQQARTALVIYCERYL